MKYSQIKVGDVCELTNGCAYKSKEFTENGIPVIKIANVKPGRIVKDKMQCVPEQIANEHKKQLIQRGDILLTMTGNRINGTPDSWVGKAAVFKENGEFTLNQRVCAIRANSSVIEPNFLGYVLSSWKSQLYFIKRSTSSGGQANISPDTVKNYSIPYPTMDTQKRIVRILSALDQKIELNNTESNTLQSIIDTQYRKVFSGNENNNKVKASDLFEYEGGYSYTSAELADESDIGMMTIKNFERTGGFKVDGFKALSPKKGTIKTAALYDIFISCTDVTQNADIIGNAVMLLDTDKYSTVTYSMDLVRIIPKINRFVLYAILSSKDFKSFALGYKSGTTVLHLNKKCLAEYEIALPDERSLDFFGATVKKACKKIAINLAENRTLRQIRDTLLPKLMSGEINLNEIK